MNVGYHDANNVTNFGGDPVTQLNFKNVFVYEIWLIAIREVAPPFDEEQPYARPYQPKHSPSICEGEERINNICVATI